MNTLYFILAIIAVISIISLPVILKFIAVFCNGVNEKDYDKRGLFSHRFEIVEKEKADGMVSKSTKYRKYDLTEGRFAKKEDYTNLLQKLSCIKFNKNIDSINIVEEQFHRILADLHETLPFELEKEEHSPFNNLKIENVIDILKRYSEEDQSSLIEDIKVMQEESLRLVSISFYDPIQLYEIKSNLNQLKEI